MSKFIGDKKIKETRETADKTPGGTAIVEVEYEDGQVEKFSQLTYDLVASDKSCDATSLREKRVQPVVATVLAILREYGIKVGDTPYFAALLNLSLNNNVEEATKILWATVMPKPQTLDDVDFVTIDRVLTAQKKTLNDVIDPGKPGV